MTSLLLYVIVVVYYWWWWWWWNPGMMSHTHTHWRRRVKNSSSRRGNHRWNPISLGRFLLEATFPWLRWVNWLTSCQHRKIAVSMLTLAWESAVAAAVSTWDGPMDSQSWCFFWLKMVNDKSLIAKISGEFRWIVTCCSGVSSSSWCQTSIEMCIPMISPWNPSLILNLSLQNLSQTLLQSTWVAIRTP